MTISQAPALIRSRNDTNRNVRDSLENSNCDGDNVRQQCAGTEIGEASEPERRLEEGKALRILWRDSLGRVR